MEIDRYYVWSIGRPVWIIDLDLSETKLDD